MKTGDELGERREKLIDAALRQAAKRGPSTAERYSAALERQRGQRGMPNNGKYFAAVRNQSEPRRDTPTPSRITMALNLGDHYGPEVDRACGVEEPTVDLWETGELVPTREQLQRLAFLTGVRTSFFYLPDPVPVEDLRICGMDDVFGPEFDAPPPADEGRLF